MEASVIVTHADFLLLEKEWGVLTSKIGEKLSVFSTFQWYRCWLDHYQENSRLFIVIVKSGGVLLGIAPLHIVATRHRGVPARKLKFIENRNSLHNDFIIGPDNRINCLQLILDFLFENSKSWDFIELLNVPESSSNLPCLNQYLEDNNIRFGARSGLNSPYLDIEGSWDDYYAARSKQSKRTLRNINNRINKAGLSEIIHIETYEDYLKNRNDLYEVAKNSWTEEIGDSINSHQNKAFFEDLIKMGSEVRWLSIWGLRVNNKLVAFEVHLVYGHVAHSLRASFLKQMANISPGAYLDRSIIEEMFKNPRGISRYDFGGSFDNYKKKWTSNSTKHTNLHVFNGSAYSTCLYCYEYKFIKLLKSIRTHLGKK